MYIYTDLLIACFFYIPVWARQTLTLCEQGFYKVKNVIIVEISKFWDTRLVRHLTIYVGFIVLLATTYRQWRDCN